MNKEAEKNQDTLLALVLSEIDFSMEDLKGLSSTATHIAVDSDGAVYSWIGCPTLEKYADNKFEYTGVPEDELIATVEGWLGDIEDFPVTHNPELYCWQIK